jgi:hypothetical protein
MRYEPRIGPWFHLLAAGLTALTAILLLLAPSAGPVMWIAGAVVAIGLLATILPIYLRTHYDVNEANVHVRFGLMDRQIPYQSIVSIRPVRNYQSSAAASPERVEIVYNTGRYVDSIFISPVDREGFIREVEERRPHKN